MTFVTIGLAIAGVASIAIPIIIHLLWRQRKKPVDWAAMRFLLEAFRKHKRRLQVEQWLLLAVRCLILAVLGFALARPILEAVGVGDGGSQRTVLLIIDDGLASGVRDANNQAALDHHIEQAVEVINALSPAEAVGVITASRPASAPILPASLDHAAAIRLIESIKHKESATDFAAALRLTQAAVEELRREGQSVALYLFSDFRAGSAAIEDPLPSLFNNDENVLLLASSPAAEARANVQITAIEPVRRVILPGAADASQQVVVRLERHGGEMGRSTSRVRLGGQGLAATQSQQVEWQVGQSQTSITFTIEPLVTGSEEIGLIASINEADGLDADNTRHTVVDVRDKVRVAMISPPTFERIGMMERLTSGQWIRRALVTGEDDPIDLTDIAPTTLDDIELRTIDAAILTRPDRLTDRGWNALQGFVNRGGLLMIVPPSEVNVHAWTDRIPQALNVPWRIALEVKQYENGLILADEQPSSELMRMLSPELTDLTRSLMVWRTLPVEMAETQATRVLHFEDGSPMMIMSAPGISAEDALQEPGAGRGLIVYLAVAPYLGSAPGVDGWSNLPVQTFMVPLFQETIRQGLNIVRAQQRITVGEQSAVAGLPRSASAFLAADGERIELAGSGKPARPFRAAGVYGVVDAGNQRVGRVAVNIDAHAGRTDVQSEAVISRWLNESGQWTIFDAANPAAPLATAETGRSIAGWLLAALLALVLAETILARRFSHAYMRRASRNMLSDGLRPTVVG